MVLKRVNQFRQNTVEGHFYAAPIWNRRRTERMILVFSKGTIQRAGEDFNQSEFLVPIALLQTVHLSVGLENTYAAAGVGEVGVPEGAQEILREDRSPGSQAREERAGKPASWCLWS
jgi:hypothetical protein